jgi:formylglycine-generating enzyme required for sulfatase activity
MIYHARLKRFIAIVVLTLPAVAQTATIDFVTVGNSENDPDSTGYGAVDYEYNIGKYEVTAGQYTEFLNSVAATTDNYGLYNASMWSSIYGCKIEQTVSSGNYSYSVASEYVDRPVNYVSFWDAARFCNWLHNGQGGGDTESGSYINIESQSTFARQDGALYFLPTEDEWYKAAYHENGGNYSDYPTSSDSTPSNQLVDPDPGNNATFRSGGHTIGYPYYRTEMGAHERSKSFYGTFDQGGNVYEWNETIVDVVERGVRGGSFTSNYLDLDAATRGSFHPLGESYDTGFRVAVSIAIPEPGSLAMLAGLAVMGLIWWRRRK